MGRLVSLILAFGFLAIGASLGDATAEPRFRRGVGIHSMLNWGVLELGKPGRYALRPFSGPDYELPEPLLRAVAAAGFDFVRLTVDPGPFLQLTGPARDALDGHLMAVVRRLVGHNLSVVVDLHSNEQVAAYNAQTIIASEDAPIFRDYVALVRRTAQLLNGAPRGRLAFELMNEPPYGYDPQSQQRWQRMQEALHAAARAEAPNLTLILTGAHGGDREGLQVLDPKPFQGSAVLYSFHYYEPHDFTHQGVPDAGLTGRYRQYLSDLPYPSASVPREMVDAAIQANVDSDGTLNAAERLIIRRLATSKVSAYVASNRNRAAIARDFDTVSEWARKHVVPAEQILLGEFGATRSYDNNRAADPISYENWIGDVRSEAEARGFGWAIWALTGTGGMAIVDTDGGDRLHQGTLRALGLKMPRDGR